MTYYGGRELAASFRTVRRNTIQIAEDIPESSYGFKPAEGTRTVAQLLAHTAMVSAFQSHVHQNHLDSLAKVNFPEFTAKSAAEEAKLHTKAEIIAFLKADGDRFADYLEGLPESFLAQPVAMPPGADPATKSRFEMLLSAKEHEMHHRGQLMVIQRMLGLKPHLTRQREERFAPASHQPQAHR